MSEASGQKFIARNRAPRVQIEYDVELYGAQKKVQLPFVMGVMSDLSGKSKVSPPEIEDRSFLEIDADNFDSRMRGIAPRVAFAVPNTLTGEGNLEVDLTFERMDDFSPGAIAARIEPLRALLQARTELSNLMTYMDGKAGAEALLERILAAPALLHAISGMDRSEPGAADREAILDALRAAAPEDAPATDATADALASLAGAAPAEEPKEDRTGDALASLAKAAPADTPETDGTADALASLAGTAPAEEPEDDRTGDALASLSKAAPVDAPKSDATADALASLAGTAPADEPEDDRSDDALASLAQAAPVGMPASDDTADALASLADAAPEDAPDMDSSDDALASLASALPEEPSPEDSSGSVLADLAAAAPDRPEPADPASETLERLAAAADKPDTGPEDPAGAALASLSAPPPEAVEDAVGDALESLAPAAPDTAETLPAGQPEPAVSKPAQDVPNGNSASLATVAGHDAAPAGTDSATRDPSGGAPVTPEGGETASEAPASDLTSAGDIGGSGQLPGDDPTASGDLLEEAAPDTPDSLDDLLSDDTPDAADLKDDPLAGAGPNGPDSLDDLLIVDTPDAADPLDDLLGEGATEVAGLLNEDASDAPDSLLGDVSTEAADPLDDLFGEDAPDPLDDLLDGVATGDSDPLDDLLSGDTPEAADLLADPVSGDALAASDPLNDLLSGDAPEADDPLDDLLSGDVPEADDPLDDLLSSDAPDPLDDQLGTAPPDGGDPLDDLLNADTSGDPDALDDLLAEAAPEAVDPLDDLLGDLGIGDDIGDGPAAQAQDSPQQQGAAQMTPDPGFAFGTLSAERPDAARLRRKRFRMALFGDFSGRAARGAVETGAELAARKPILLDLDTAEEVIEGFATTLILPIGKEGAGVEVELGELDDLHPDELYENLPLFSELKGLRGQLSSGATAAHAQTQLRGWAEKHGQHAAPARRTSGGNTVRADLKLSDFQRLIGDTGGALRQAGPVEDLLARVVGPHIRAVPDADAAAMKAAVDASVSAAMRLILHHPEFQSIEAQWRSIDLIARSVESDDTQEVVLYDISAEEIAADLAAAEDLAASGLARLLTEGPLDEELGRGGYSALLGLYTFEETPPHADLLGRIARVAAHVDAPFFAAMTPGFMETDKKDRHPLVAQAWDDLRAMPEARHLGLATPRFLLRRPYGAKSEPIYEFDFEEFTETEGLKGMLWANPVVLVAILLARSFKMNGAHMNLGSVMSLGEMPYHVVRDRHGDQVALPCTERNITESKLEKVMTRGFMPVVSIKGRDEIRLASFQSVGGGEILGPWSGESPPPPSQPKPAAAPAAAADDLDDLLAGFDTDTGGEAAGDGDLDADLAALLDDL